MSTLRFGALEVDVPDRWDARAFTRAEHVQGEQTNTVLHLANFPLPTQAGDFGGGAVERMRPGHAFIALVEFGPESIGTELFAADGLPTLTRDSFDPNVLQRGLPGQSGAQHFFTANGRPYCLYVVLGAHTMRFRLVPELNRVLGRVTVLD